METKETRRTNSSRPASGQRPASGSGSARRPEGVSRRTEGAVKHPDQTVKRPMTPEEREYARAQMERKKKLQAKRRKELEKKKRIRFFVINAFITLFLAAGITYIIVHLFTDKKTLRDKGIEHINKGEYAEAVKDLEASLDTLQWFSEKLDTDTKMYLAEGYMGCNRFRDANEIYIELQSKNTGEFDNNYLLSLIQLSQACLDVEHEDYEAAIPVLKSAVESGNRKMNLYLGTCYFNQGDYETMLDCYQSYITEFGLNTYTAYMLSKYYLSVKDFTSAGNYISKGLALSDTEYIEQLRYSEIVYYEMTNQYMEAYNKAKLYVIDYPDSENAKRELDFLDSRVNINEEPVHIDPNRVTEEVPEEVTEAATEAAQ